MDLLRAEEKRIRDLFNDYYQFEIPSYQRPYVWGETQVTQLYEDLEEALREYQLLSPEEQSEYYYFLGSMVLVKKERHELSWVVDGQQRLITLVILLNVLRYLFEDTKKKDVVTQYLYREGNVLENREGFYRLTPHLDCKEFFRKYIQDEQGLERLLKGQIKCSNDEKIYQKNAKLIYKLFKSWKEEERTALFLFIVSQCSLIVISTPDLDASYRIFSTINTRGLDLAPLDIIKSHLFKKVEEKEGGKTVQAAYEKTWKDISENLEREDLSHLLTYIRFIIMKSRCKNNHDLYTDFESHIFKAYEPKAIFEDLLKPYAEIYYWIKDEDYNQGSAEDENINRALRWLNKLSFDEWRAPVLVFAKRFQHESAKFLLFLEKMESLSYFLLLNKSNTIARHKRYAEIMKEIEKESFQGNALAVEKLLLSPKEQAAFREILDGGIYDNLKNNHAYSCQLLLLRLEELLHDGTKIQGVKTISVEHVLPQTVPKQNSSWLSWTEEERQYWTHRLANLVLLSRQKNSASGNKGFKEKKETYFTSKQNGASPFMLTNEVCREKSWTPEILEKRQKRLVGLLLQHWAIQN